ncbi:unnamed protein product [Clonostachys rosea]|uniref:Uncharacterized protein n=1 Tax=Bionectria ochroleuca TaxID=29856 RepID=A0ABY6UEI8_BIOOC|nr:unnamed protein product [Clonostachys rosea]
MASPRRGDIFAMAQWETSALGGRYMQVAEVGPWTRGFNRSSDSGEKLQDRWESEWDHRYTGWRWGGDDMATANSQLLLNPRSGNEKKGLGLQGNPACSPRGTGDDTTAGQLVSPRGAPILAAVRRPKATEEDVPDEQVAGHRAQSRGYKGEAIISTRNAPMFERFSEAYFAQDYIILLSQIVRLPLVLQILPGFLWKKTRKE